MTSTQRSSIQSTAALPDFSEVASALRILSPDQVLEPSLQESAYLEYYAINCRAEFPGLIQQLGRSASNEQRIATQLWQLANAKGTVLIIHGYFDHVGLYGHVIRFWLRQGYNVLAFDLLGHGLSDGTQAAIASFDDYAEVLDKLLQEFQHLNAPWYGLGQSTGGAVWLNYQWNLHFDKNRVSLKKVFLLAPLIKPRGWGLQRWAYKFLNKLLKTIPRDFVTNSSDDKFLDFLANKDPLQARIISVLWVGAMKLWIDYCAQQTTNEDSDFVIIQGTKDVTVDAEFNVKEILRISPRSNEHWIAGANHQLVNESEQYREQVFQLIANELAL